MLLSDPSRFSQWLLASMVIWIAGTTSAGPIATAQTLGFRDLSYANNDNLRAPTGSKPESKAWFNDNTWCAILFNPALHATDIYKLDLTTQTWMDTGTTVDDRPTAKATRYGIKHQESYT